MIELKRLELKIKANFLYKDQSNAYFMDNTSFEQFSLSLENIGDQQLFLKDGTDVDVLYFNNNPVTITLPIKMDFKVTVSPPE